MWASKENAATEERVSRAQSLATEANEIFVRSGDYAKAVELYSQAIRLHPNEVRFYSNRSMGHLMAGSAEAALADGRKCVSLMPRWAKGHFRVATAQEKMGRLAEAEDAYADAVACEVPGSRAHSDYTQAYQEVRIRRLEAMGFSRPVAVAAEAQHKSLEAAATALCQAKASALAQQVLDSDDEEELRAAAPTPPRPLQAHPQQKVSRSRSGSASSTLAQQPQQQHTPPPINIVPGDPLTDPRNPLHCDSLWVGNLRDDLSESEFRAKFAPFGRVRSAALMLEKHCGFVTFTDWRCAGAAMAELQQSNLRGWPMWLKYPDRALKQGAALKSLVLRKSNQQH